MPSLSGAGGATSSAGSNYKSSYRTTLGGGANSTSRNREGGGVASRSNCSKKRPFISALVDDLLGDVSDFVDEAIATHREWVINL